ncbi:MAG: ABC transporter permease [Acidimicrobiaceae bacterium]|nr:ABC transporter permease [Acidimicrobiaceae bacterium]
MMTTLEAPAAIADVEAARAAPRPTTGGAGLPLRMLRKLVASLVSIGVVLAAWILFLRIFHVSHFIGKGPADVWNYLVSSKGAAANRTAVAHESLTTLRDAFIGLAVGTVAAIACAVAFNLWRPVERTLMPLAMVLRSVPLMAMTPLIVLIFGRDLKTVAVIGGIVAFFATLVNVNLALRRTPRESLDVCRAYGASRFETMRRVQIPSAVPALMASLRIAAPLALVGALLAEWLATGKGLGYRILEVGALSDYSGLWSRVVLVTLYSVILYKLIGAIEKVVVARFAPTIGA